MTSAKQSSAPFGAYSFGWAYWQADADRRRGFTRADALEAVKIALGGVAFAAVTYAWTVLLFALEVP